MQSMWNDASYSWDGSERASHAQCAGWLCTREDTLLAGWLAAGWLLAERGWWLVAVAASGYQ